MDTKAAKARAATEEELRRWARWHRQDEGLLAIVGEPE